MADEVTVKAIQITTEQIGDSTEPIKKLAASLKRLRDTLSGSWVKTSADGMHNLADAFATIGDNAEKLERAADAIERIKKATGKVNKTMSQVMSNTAAGAQTVTEKLTETKPPEQGKGGAGKIKEVGENTDKAKKSAEKASNAFTKLFSSLKRIAVYRAIRTALSALANSAKQGLDNYYQYSKNTGGGLSTAMDNLKQSSTFVTNAFGTVIGSLVEKLEPVISWLLDGIAELFNKISATMAVMSNQSTYTAAKKGMIEYAKSAEAAKRALMGFDEINQIALDRSQINDYGKFFETRSTSDTFSPKILAFLENAKEVWKNDIWPLLEAILDVIKSLWTVLEPIVKALWLVLKPIITLIGSAITQVLKWISEAIGYTGRPDSAGKAIEEGIRLILGGELPLTSEQTEQGSGGGTTAIEYPPSVIPENREELSELNAILQEATDLIKKEKITTGNLSNWLWDERGSGYKYREYEAQIRAAMELKSALGFANGGSPLSGSLFYAGEAGPELVANVGGTSNVLNEAQIANAMYIAMSRALSENGGDTAVTLRLDGDAIYRNVIKRNSNQARSTGVSPFMA